MITKSFEKTTSSPALPLDAGEGRNKKNYRNTDV